MRPTTTGILIFCVLTSAFFAQPAEKNLLGFSADSTAREKELEARFDSILSRENLRDWMRRLAAQIEIVSRTIENFAREIDRAAYLIK